MLAKLALWPERFSNKIIECYLTQDPDYYQDLTILSGREILFFLKDLRLQIKINFTRTKMRLGYAKALTPQILKDASDLSLEGRSFDLLAFARQKAKRSHLLSEHLVAYHGDLFLLEALVKLVKDRHFLENVPLPAFVKAILMNSIPPTFKWQKQTFKTFQDTIVDYLQEELKLIPSAKHFALLQDEQLQLDERVDRLEARFSNAFNS